MDELLNVIISYAFNWTTFDVNPEIIPNNCFGCFVTVKRSKKLSNYPEEIHGCIGYWSENPSKEELYKKLKDVARSATWEDSRKDYHKTPIYLDPETIFEISFLMKPLLPISNNGKFNNNKLFNNDEYGLIVESSSGRATFLPKVFENIEWNLIKEKLLQKGDIINNYKFFAYKTKTYEKQIFNILESNYLNKIENEIINFFSKNFTNFIPYSMNKNNKITYNKNEYVRNIATLYDLLQLNLPNGLYNKIKNNIIYYSELNTISRQSSAFLLLALNKLNIKKDIQEKICNDLYSQLNELERDFELGEVLISLSKCCPKNSILEIEKKKMFEENIDDIFRLNWETKFLYTFYKSNNKKHFNKLKTKILYFIKNNNNWETNVSAVCFEALSTLYNIEKDNDIKTNIFYMFYLLMNRYKNGLFYFEDGTARIDITGHVINGIIFYNNK